MAEGRRPVHGGLRIPQPAAVSENEYDTIVRKWAEAKAWAEAEKSRLIGTDIPPHLSGQELMTISPTEYAEIYTRRLGWRNEVSRQLAGVRVALNMHECALTDLGRKIRHTHRSLGSKKSADELKDHVGLQPHHEQVELEVEKYRALKILLEQEFDEAEQNLKAISRQVEVRKEEFSGERRDGNMPRAVARDQKWVRP